MAEGSRFGEYLDVTPWANPAMIRFPKKKRNTNRGGRKRETGNLILIPIKKMEDAADDTGN